MRDQLDRAVDVGLAHAGAGTPEMSQAAFDAGRQRVLAAVHRGNARPLAAARPVRPRRWLVAAAAGIAALVGVGLIPDAAKVDTPAHTPEPRPAAADMLRRAADLALTVKDTPVGPGQYRYVSERAEGITMESPGASTGQLITRQVWIPADPRQEWLERRGAEGEPRWLPGLEGEGQPPSQPPALIGEWKARCGASGYYSEQAKAEREAECAHGTWWIPTAPFLAGLPADPRQLYERLVKDFANGNAADSAAVVQCVGIALSSGMVPAEYRARLYRALEHVPGLVITDESANLDGRKGTAVGVRNGKDFMEIIIDPSNGEYIGQRYVVAEEDMGLKPGMVRSFSAITMGVVDAMGAVPAR